MTWKPRCSRHGYSTEVENLRQVWANSARHDGVSSLNAQAHTVSGAKPGMEVPYPTPSVVWDPQSQSQSSWIESSTKKRRHEDALVQPVRTHPSDGQPYLPSLPLLDPGPSRPRTVPSPHGIHEYIVSPRSMRIADPLTPSRLQCAITSVPVRPYWDPACVR